MTPRIGNRTGRRLGLLLAALLASALAFLLVLPVAGLLGPRPGEETELRELYVREMLAAEELDSELVLLQAVGESVVIPLFVTTEDAQAIRAASIGEEAGGTDLLEQTVAGFGAEIRAIVLDQAGASLGGLVIVDQRGDQRSIEISPGAAIAAALSTGQPILTTAEALEATGLNDEDLRRMVEAEAESEGENADEERPTYDL